MGKQVLNNSEFSKDSTRKLQKEEPLTLQTIMNALDQKFESEKRNTQSK